MRNCTTSWGRSVLVDAAVSVSSCVFLGLGKGNAKSNSMASTFPVDGVRSQTTGSLGTSHRSYGLSGNSRTRSNSFGVCGAGDAVVCAGEGLSLLGREGVTGFGGAGEAEELGAEAGVCTPGRLSGECGSEPVMLLRIARGIEDDCAEANDCMSKAKVFSWSELARPDAASCKKFASMGSVEAASLTRLIRAGVIGVSEATAETSGVEALCKDGYAAKEGVAEAA